MLWLILLLLAVLLAASLPRLRFDLRSYTLLARFADPNASGPLLKWEARSVNAEDIAFPSGNGSTPGRLFLPAGVAHPSGIAVVHGIHHLGMNEPRLVGFARAAASTGFAVLTPQVSALADYRVDAASVETIGAAATWLDERLGTGPVTLVGVSVAGGLALRAACDPQYSPHLRTLVLMGAYANLARVGRFLATGRAKLPDGRIVSQTADDYGAATFVYARLEQFFSSADIPLARQALRDWLREQPEKARPLLEQLSPEAREMMKALLDRRIELLRPRLLAAIEADAAALAAASPEDCLAALRVPVYLLHGSDDNVIPSAECLWLARSVPPRELRAVLITSALSHVDPKAGRDWIAQLRLVHFLGAVLRDAS